MVKYITLIFSDTNGKPSKHFRPTGYVRLGKKYHFRLSNQKY